MKKILALAIVALVVPSVALAGGKPTNPGHSLDSHGKSQSASHSQAAPTVMYVLKGILTDYEATGSATFTSPGGAPTSFTYPCNNGWVTINVIRANHHGAALKALTQPLSICLSASPATRVVVKGGTLDSGALNSYGMVKVRFTKKFDLTQFLTNGTAKQIIVKKPVSS